MSQSPVRVVEIPGIEFDRRKTYLEVTPGDDMINVSRHIARRAAVTMKSLIDGRTPAEARAMTKPGTTEPKIVVNHNGEN